MLPGMIAALGMASGGSSGVGTVTNIGTNANLSGTTVAISNANAKAGSLIVVACAETNTTGVIGTLADSAGHTYTAVSTIHPNGSNANGSVSIFYCPNCLALSGGTITYTRNTSGDKASISAFYWTGAATVSPLDTAVTASASGTSATPSVTSGTPTQTNELFVGLCVDNNTVGFTQAAGWTTPFNSAGGIIIINGAHRTNSALATLTYAPTFPVSVTWCLQVVGFKHV